MEFYSSFTIDLSPFTLVSTASGILRVDKIQKGLKLSSGDQEDPSQVITNVLGGQKKQTIQLVLKNGNSLILGENVIVYTLDGWKQVKDLKPSDLVLNKIDSLLNQVSISPKVAWKDFDKEGGRYKKAYMPISIPSVLSNSFSEWLGIICSIGKYNSSNGVVSILTEDSKLSEHYLKLTKEVLNITPQKTKDKRPDRKTEHWFISKNVVEFLKIFFGTNYNLRKIPSFLLEASAEDQKSFLKGVSYSSYMDKKQVVFYSGTSKPISEFIFLALSNLGYFADIYTKKIPDNEISSYFYVKILGKNPSAEALFLNLDHSGLINKSPSVLVNNTLKDLKVKSFHPLYSSFTKAKNEKLVPLKLISELGGETRDNYFFVPVDKIISLGVRDLSGIKYLSAKGIVVNQIVLGGQL